MYTRRYGKNEIDRNANALLSQACYFEFKEGMALRDLASLVPIREDDAIFITRIGVPMPPPKKTWWTTVDVVTCKVYDMTLAANMHKKWCTIARKSGTELRVLLRRLVDIPPSEVGAYFSIKFSSMKEMEEK